MRHWHTPKTENKNVDLQLQNNTAYHDKTANIRHNWDDEIKSKRNETEIQRVLPNESWTMGVRKDFQATKMGTHVLYLIQCIIQTLVKTFQIQQDNSSSSLHADFNSIYIATDLNIWNKAGF